MAAEVSSIPTNGHTYGHQSTPSTAPVAAAPSQAQNDLSKEQVAWYFVESYYTTMSQTPEKLHLFFNKRSQLVSGVEEEKSSVALGQKAIKEKLSSLNLTDTKVRVTNVDSQASDSNIIIQVIGEMSTSSLPHRKFVQTFVLASQTNGYFVLNDIFRYIKDDEDDENEGEDVNAGVQTEDAGVGGEEEVKEEVKTETLHVEAAGTEKEVKEAVLEQVEAKLEEIKAEAETAQAAEPTTNGSTPEAEPEVAEAEEAPAAAVSESKAEEVEAEVAQEDIAEPEKPQDPLPTPKAEEAAPAPAAAAATPSAPPKPAVPKSWAQLAAGNQAKAAANTSAPRAAPTPSSQPSSKPTPSAPSAAPSAPATSASNLAREASPDSNKEGSTGGWQTAGADHVRKQSRAANANAPQLGQSGGPQQGHDGRVRAFVKNVTEEVDAEQLKSALSKFGEVVYFDVARVKKAAFAEFKTVAGFNAAVAASPIRVGNEDVWVEERRVAGGGFSRGGARGGRGGFEGRGGAPRGGYGPRGGRGGSGNVTPRGGRPQQS